MEVVADLEWLVQAVGSGLPGAIAVFEVKEQDRLILVAANDSYRSLFSDSQAPHVGEAVRTVMPGSDPQLWRIVQGVLRGEAFHAESWAVTAPRGTYSTGIAYCDWSMRLVDVFGQRAVVLLVTDVTSRTEREQSLVEEVVRLRDLISAVEAS